jgi:hypothetical protein
MRGISSLKHFNATKQPTSACPPRTTASEAKINANKFDSLLQSLRKISDMIELRAPQRDLKIEALGPWWTGTHHLKT